MKQQCHWYYQQNMEDIYNQPIVDGCAINNKPYHGFTVIPFDDNITILELQEPFVIIASAIACKRITTIPALKAGVFHIKENFTPQMYAKQFGQNYLNADAQTLQLKHLNTIQPTDGLFFCKCCDDYKEVAGKVINYEELMEMNVDVITFQDGILDPEMDIILAKVKPITAEYRLFFIEKQCITGSQYQPTKSSYVPKEIEQFATEQIQHWQPHAIFAIDICISNDQPYIIECSTFNACGWYNADNLKLVKAVSEYVEQQFLESNGFPTRENLAI